jgi:hypothetical protein
MYTSKVTRHAINASIVLAMLAGCSGGVSQMAPKLAQPGAASVQDGRVNRILASQRSIVSSHPVTTPSFFNPDAKGKPLIFLSDATNSAVDIYLQADKYQKMVGQITGLGPGALAADTAGNLYVGNYTSSGVSNIPVYAPPYTGPPQTTLDDSGYFDTGVAVSTAGVVAAANQCDAPNCNSTGNVTFYARNSTTACATIADPKNFPHPVYDAFDDKGNLYIEGFSSPSGTTVIGEVKGACKAKKIMLLKVANPPSLSGIQVDKRDRIALLTYGNSTYEILNLYKTPKNGSLGSPISSTQFALPVSGLGPVVFVFSASNAHAYTVDVGSAFLMDKYDFPAGGAAKKTIEGAWTGLAVTPPSVP